jgi:hypothetical protein
MFRLSKVALANTLTQLVGGLQKHLPTGTLLVANTSYTTSQLATSFTSLVTSIQATATAKAAYQAAVKAEDELYAELFPLVSGVRAVLYQMYRGSIETLADCGISPHKVAIRTAAEKLAAAAKAKATRAARHTLGKKQKAAITGSSAAAAPVSPASPPAPVPVPSNGSGTQHTS